MLLISSNPYRRMLTNTIAWDKIEEIFNEKEIGGNVVHLFWIDALNNLCLSGIVFMTT